MKGVIKLMTICFYVVVSGCQNGDLKTPSTKTEISEKQSKKIADEKVSFNEGVNKRKNEDAASNGSNISVAVVANPVSTMKVNNELIGIWMCIISPRTLGKCKNAAESTIRHIEPMYQKWEFKSNGTWNGRIDSKDVESEEWTTKWKLKGNSLIEYNNSNEAVYTIKWISTNSFRIESDRICTLYNAVFERVKSFEPVKVIIHDDDKKSMTCPRCSGIGHHACSLMTGDPFLKDLDYYRCMSSNAPDQTQVSCYMCKGSGIWQY